MAAKGAAMVLDDDNRTMLKRTIKDLSDVAQTIAAHKTQIEQSMSGAARSADNLVKLTASLNAEVPTLLAGINKNVAALGTATDELARTSKAVGTIINDARPELQQFTRRTLPEAGLLVTELRQLTGTLTRVARELEREPSSLVFGRKTPSRGPGE
jgi:phospholipid/cholesterol/gamma-HCH transport system substrate-binding protein